MICLAKYEVHARVKGTPVECWGHANNMDDATRIAHTVKGKYPEATVRVVDTTRIIPGTYRSQPVYTLP